MCAIPIFTAAGRIKLLMIVCPQYGFLPDVAGLANANHLVFGKACTLAMSSAPPLGRHRGVTAGATGAIAEAVIVLA
jgi:hypothetical protein